MVMPANRAVMTLFKSKVDSQTASLALNADLPIQSQLESACFFSGYDTVITIHDDRQFMCTRFKDTPFVFKAHAETPVSMSFTRLEAATVFSVYELSEDAYDRLIAIPPQRIMEAFRKVRVDSALPSVHRPVFSPDHLPQVEDARPVLSQNGYIGYYYPSSVTLSDKRYLVIKNDAGEHLLDAFYEHYIQEQRCPLIDLCAPYEALRNYTRACNNMIAFEICRSLGITDCVQLVRYATTPAEIKVPGEAFTATAERLGVKPLLTQTINFMESTDNDSNVIVTNMASRPLSMQPYSLFYLSNPIYGLYILPEMRESFHYDGALPICYRPLPEQQKRIFLFRPVPEKTQALIATADESRIAVEPKYVLPSDDYDKDVRTHLLLTRSTEWKLNDAHLCASVFYSTSAKAVS